MSLWEQIFGTKEDLVDLLNRTVWTFIQAFLGFFTFDALSSDLSLNLLQVAAASGLSAVVTVLTAYARQRIRHDEMYEHDDFDKHDDDSDA